MSFQVYREPATDPAVPFALLLLHGTGGTERDLVEIGKALVPGAAIVSPRGKVQESIYTRWFRRFEEGVFDEDDIRRQADDLAEFVKGENQRFVGIGYSNGANMGSALMTLYPEVLDGLVMWRGMQLFREPVQSDLSGKKILMTNGTVDPMGPLESAQRQAEFFRSGGADVTLRELGTGHGLTQSDFEITREWLSKF
ncbi:MAG: alpha/beta hydrolase [Armatimonadetes bacterium]|nr:alpha/beta hydrolase [Armatimonadota bacterium]